MSEGETLPEGKSFPMFPISICAPWVVGERRHRHHERLELGQGSLIRLRRTARGVGHGHPYGRFAW